MGPDDVTTDQSQMTHDHGREANDTAGTAVRGGLGRQGEPLFRRFAVPREWRAKDGATG
ncbi:MAG TPA: hypothetical protein VE953_26980 [Terriglobales bacterium]|nr:hypothetical protein [Terriglobales bacterium]